MLNPDETIMARWDMFKERFFPKGFKSESHHQAVKMTFFAGAGSGMRVVAFILDSEEEMESAQKLLLEQSKITENEATESLAFLIKNKKASTMNQPNRFN